MTGGPRSTGPPAWFSGKAAAQPRRRSRQSPGRASRNKGPLHRSGFALDVPTPDAETLIVLQCVGALVGDIAHPADALGFPGGPTLVGEERLQVGRILSSSAASQPPVARRCNRSVVALPRRLRVLSWLRPAGRPTSHTCGRGAGLPFHPGRACSARHPPPDTEKLRIFTVSEAV